MIKDKIFLDNLPNRPGVYQMLGEERKVLYVGKARDLQKRVSTYFSSKVQDPKTLSLMKQAKSIEVTITHTEHEALLLECFLIKKYLPRYNVLLRDDKSYPYILITADQPYPRITFYRGVKKGKGLYFGPYPNTADVREAIHLIQKLFHLRGCEDSFFSNRKRPCLYHQIGLCSGPCVGLISPEEYQQNVQNTILFLKGKSQLLLDQLKAKMVAASRMMNYEYAARLRDQITSLEAVQEQQYVSTAGGEADIIALDMQAGLACIHLLSIRGGRLLGSRSYYPSLPAEVLSKEILSAFISQHYVDGPGKEDLPEEIILGEDIEDRLWLEEMLTEQVGRKVKIIKPSRGERRKWLEMATANAKQAAASRLLQKTNLEGRIQALQQILALEKLPQRIECFDISHSMGEETVASCVVFNREGPLKSDYRRFNIQGITGGDDVAAMRQALLRRFTRKGPDAKPLPDIVLIDGGPAQLAAADEALAELRVENVLLIGVAKGVERKPGLETLHFTDRSPLNLPKDSIGLHLIQQIRDEAHRFAITGHRKRRDKKRRTSVLEAIPGIGAKRRRALLKHFGGLQALEEASLEQILEVEGINESLALQVYERFHGKS